MFFRRIFLTTALAVSSCLLARPAQAQLIADQARAIQARDSVLARANHYRATIEQQARGFDVKVLRLGKRRRVVHGYYLRKSANPNVVSTTRQRAWKHVTRTLATGVVRERYVGYLEGTRVLEESRTNHQTTYVRLHRLVIEPNSKILMGRAKLGLLTSEGYVQWGRELFLLTTPTKI